MCISLCACGGNESTSGDNKEDGFTPEQVTETPVTTEEDKEISLNMTVEEMQQYYDATQFVGQPTLMKLHCTKAIEGSNNKE